MSDVEVIDCTTSHKSHTGQANLSTVDGFYCVDEYVPSSLAEQSPRQACIVPVTLTMHEVWCGSSHKVSVEDGGRRTTKVVHTPSGIPHGHEMWVEDTVLLLRFRRDDSLERHDAAGRYSVRLDGDDVIYHISVNAKEQRDGFSRDLSVEEEALRQDRAHLRIRCAGGRASAERPMRFDRKGLGGRGAAHVRFLLTSP